MAGQQSNVNASPVNSPMHFMTKVFLMVFGVLSLRFASGLVVYWVTSNIWRIGQQHLVLNKIYDEANNAPPPKSRPDDEDDEPPNDPPSLGQASEKKSPPTGAAKPSARTPVSPTPPRNPNLSNRTNPGT